MKHEADQAVFFDNPHITKAPMENPDKHPNHKMSFAYRGCHQNEPQFKEEDSEKDAIVRS